MAKSPNAARTKSCSRRVDFTPNWRRFRVQPLLRKALKGWKRNRRNRLKPALTKKRANERFRKTFGHRGPLNCRGGSCALVRSWKRLAGEIAWRHPLHKRQFQLSFPNRDMPDRQRRFNTAAVVVQE